MFTVGVKSPGETRLKGLAVFIFQNAGDANDGLATATNTDVEQNAELLKKLRQMFGWFMLPAPATLSSHIGDATGAHACLLLFLSLMQVLTPSKYKR